MTKKILTFCISFLFSFCIANKSFAHLVLGADFYQTLVDTDRETETLVNDKYDNIAAVLGFDFNGVGIEGFYQTYSDVENDYGKTSKIKAYGADFILRLPTSEIIDFVGSAGYINYTFDTENGDIDVEGFRVGLGLQFNLTKYIGLRTMYHYTALTKELDSIKTVNEFSAGLRIKF